jgi:ABC-type phosphate transport system substrate-binding protein
MDRASTDAASRAKSEILVTAQVRWCVGLVAVCLATLAAMVGALPASAADTTDPGTLVGEGGSFLTPVTDVLLRADTSGLAPLNPSYTDANLDGASTDFVGDGPGSFDADFVVSERPLTSSETATAKANGRTFAYVPFAATPVAVATLAACQTVTGDSTSVLCPNIPLTVPLVGLLFTFNRTSASVSPNQGLLQTLSGWNDPRVTQQNGQPLPSGDGGILQGSTLEPSAENTALMTLLDSNPQSKELFDNALNNPANAASTPSDTPSETWPLQGTYSFIGGDAGLIEKELNINAETNAPSAANSWDLSSVFPLSSVWAGAPQGSPWNIPTAALQNAAGQFVAPSATAAEASEADATIDPATNLVTFNANATDAAAYNNYMMVESYLVVPTSGLAASKASALAQYIRFVTGPVAASDEETLGAAPPTTAMVAADLKVATELDAEAATSAALSSTTTTTGSGGSSSSTSSTTSTTTSTAAAATGGTSDSTGGTGAGNSGNSGSGLASTGAPDVVPVLVAGGALVGLGVVGRRRSRRLRRRGVGS